MKHHQLMTHSTNFHLQDAQRSTKVRFEQIIENLGALRLRIVWLDGAHEMVVSEQPFIGEMKMKVCELSVAIRRFRNVARVMQSGSMSSIVS